MADLIDRDVLMKEICGNECGSVCDEECENAMCNFYDYIMDMPPANRWIPCSERLPENRERVLVCFRSGTVHIAVWYGDYDEKGAWKVTSQFPTKLYRTDTIPKWMPMPEPPEVDKQ